MANLAAVIGKPVEHSLSPVMHNAAYKHLNLDWEYRTREVEDGYVQATIKEMFDGLYQGINITMPYKRLAIHVCDTIYGAALRLGAVNTIVKKDGRLHGYSTDGDGFIQFLSKNNIDIKDVKVLLIGAGGAASSICDALFQAGAKVYLTARNAESSIKLAELINLSNPDSPWKVESVSFDKRNRDVPKCKIIINATPIGMSENLGVPIDTDLIDANHIVIDTIYHPLETQLIKESKQNGAKVFNGLGMLVHQGAIAFELMTGEKAPIDVMYKAIDAELTLREWDS